MKSIAASDLLQKNDYRDWPLFTEFRKTRAFQETYHSLYGHPIELIEPSPTDTFFGPMQLIQAKEDAEEPDTDGNGKEEKPEAAPSSALNGHSSA